MQANRGRHTLLTDRTGSCAICAARAFAFRARVTWEFGSCREADICFFDLEGSISNHVSGSCFLLPSLSRSFEGLIFPEVDNGQSKRVNWNQRVRNAILDRENEMSYVTFSLGLGMICRSVEHFFKLHRCFVR